MGVIEDAFLKINDIILLVDYITLDIEEGIEVPIILGTPFLATGWGLIDVAKRDLTIRLHDKKITLKSSDLLIILLILW